MATLVAPGADPRRTARYLHRGLIPFFSDYTLTAALALNDVIQMVKVPAGATVFDLLLATTDLDTGAGAITLHVGDGDDPDRYIASATIGQTGGMVRMGQGITTAFIGTAPAGHGFVYTADDTLDVVVAAGPSTGATTGTVRLFGYYAVDR